MNRKGEYESKICDLGAGSVLYKGCSNILVKNGGSTPDWAVWKNANLVEGVRVLMNSDMRKEYHSCSKCRISQDMESLRSS